MKGNGFLGALLLAIVAAIVLVAFSRGCGGVPAMAGANEAASGYQEQVWQYKSDREGLALEIDRQVLPYRIWGGRIMALFLPVVLVAGAGVGICYGVVGVVKSWRRRDIIPPDQHGQLPARYEELDMDGDGKPDTIQVINMDKLPGAVTAIRKGSPTPITLPDAELQRTAEWGWWGARITGAQPGIDASQEKLGQALLNRMLGTGQGQNGGQSQKFAKVSQGAVIPLLIDAGIENAVEGDHAESNGGGDQF